MALLDKLMFWRKGSDPNTIPGPDLGLDLGPMPDMNSGLPPLGFDMPGQQPQQQPDFGFAKPADMQRDEIPPEVRNAPPFGGAFMPQQLPPAQQQNNNTASTHDTQIIYAKLDAIRAMLDTIDQRIKTIERIEETKERDRGRW